MKKIITGIIFLININIIAFGQQIQTKNVVFYYQISGLVYIKEFNAAIRTKTAIQKIAKEPLSFKIVGQEIDVTDHSIFYIIQFFPIISESDTTFNITCKGKKCTKTMLSTIKSNTTYVNSDDNDKFFWIKKDEFDTYITNGFIFKSYTN